MDTINKTGVPSKTPGDSLSHQDINAINSTTNYNVEKGTKTVNEGEPDEATVNIITIEYTDSIFKDGGKHNPITCEIEIYTDSATLKGPTRQVQ